MEIPEARGMGRSGPRRRTGCLTCRARKVRCPEEKPTCANCSRLRLRCVYKSSPNAGGGVSSRRRAEKQLPTLSPTRSASAPRSDFNFFSTVLRSDDQQLPVASLQPFNEQTGAYAPDFSGPFDMLGFIGEITSELQQKHLDLTNGLSEFTSPFIVPGNLGSDVRFEEPQSTLSPDVDSSLVGVIGNPHSEGGDTDQSTASWPETKAPYEEQLLSQFVTSEPPPTIFGPVDTEWTFVRQAILALSKEFSPLLNAIYCFCDIRNATREGSKWRWAPSYYRRASTEIQSCIIGEVADSTLKRVFATVLLLMFSELLSSPELCRPGTSYFHSSYLLLQRFHNRTKSWTGFGHLLISWISLLDVKSLIAGRDGDVLLEIGALPDPPAMHREISISKPDSMARLTAAEKETAEIFSSPNYLVYEAIVSPVFRFFVNAQQVIRRIICIDIHHRSRGTLSDEFEVLQIAHKVGADLEALWNSRPPVMDVYDRPNELFSTLNQAVAVDISRMFRQYVANFLANFIYLHRVAFAIYPRTDRVNGAVDKIIQLATVEATGVSSLPISFLWPLFIAGLEGSLEQRHWVLQAMQKMADPSKDVLQRHPNAEKVLLLLEEMTRRQDATRTWADSKCVRRELFTDSFIII
ncbi:hypothetical protein ASPZODRAFT_107190 [Penicilliopsis zonata CBS 506.65]|uniref:Zn(2)-C6 fungal-type domain-containing protein n=1 Tax=Penicilliopsis zonata CBS 506.65 TaxID=1073090 RepID=A0A1L9SVC8_9EURO|nr:hypothetical protein ASPZODRAFT_107190 [Penicilliopsis zonata CBS 506.65]OJJ51027.1 hypothetical protein ASPZODRAFT_107190 [Penicilliopsis zonata CBS 506.65]